MSTRTCPICGKTFEVSDSLALPFCSGRCRQIDLGRWLGEEQRLPYLRPEEDESEGDSPAD